MIVCHCQSITDHDIRAAIDWMRASDPDTLITPGKIYHALGRRADCGGCMPLFLDTMRNCDSLAVARRDAPSQTIPNLHIVKGLSHERRRQGY
ncbi:(2Fe-2S)-binding protein [Paracoccaceae bacterium Fryx2]|nr:(2Fe-2S)-binding protein [Paracoccaceae bacterium Fryx2]